MLGNYIEIEIGGNKVKEGEGRESVAADGFCDREV